MEGDWTTKKVDKFVVLNQKLGSGAYGTVYKGFYAEDETKYVAVKTIPLKSISDSPKMLELIKREIAILKQVNHQNVVRLIDVARTNNSLYMFLEFCQDGDLKDFMMQKSEKRLSELEAVIFLKHIVEGFKRLYALKIIHRDIKPANILLNQNVAKITDFGFARVIEAEMNDPACLSRLGSPLYMAPQILEGNPFSAKCDIWSLGILFYELLYGVTPWTGDSPYNLLERIKSQPLKFPPKPVRSQKVKGLIQQMLAFNEKDRLTWDQVFNDPLIKIEETKIKQNMQNILQNKVYIDEISRSISLNKLYIDEYLVVGYLANNPLFKIDVNEDQDSETQSLNSSNSSQTESYAEMHFNNYQKEKKKHDILMKYYNYFLFERNIAFFFNFVIQKIFALQNKGEFKVKEEKEFRLVYLLGKNQMIHLERVHRQLNTKEHEKFEKVSWGSFLASKEYQKVLTLIKQDMSHCMQFFTEISKKTLEIHKQQYDVNPAQHIKKFMEIINHTYEATETFHTLYREVLQDSIKDIRQANSNSKDLLLCNHYFSICLNPYDEFRDINYDFNKFYEESENMTESELQAKMGKR